MSNREFIPVCEPALGIPEARAAQECVESGWISSGGPALRRFEESWAGFCGRRFGVAVANGSAGLEAAVAALRLQPGDEVIMPSFTIISCAHAVIRAGAVPVLVDVDPATWCMDADAVATRIGPRTRAIMVVHIYGHPVRMGPIEVLAKRHGLMVVEDAAEAHGAEYRESDSSPWRRCGSFGDVSVFSFYANKIVTTGEGGMVLTDDEALRDRLLSYRDLAFRRDRRFYHTEFGVNMRMTSLQAAVGLVQIERIGEILERKRWMAAGYNDRLRDLPALRLPVEESWARNVYWMYGVVLDDSLPFDAAHVISGLQQRDIGARPFFLGMHEQPLFLGQGLFVGESYPHTERISRRGFYLPSSTTLTAAQLDRVCVSLREVLHG
jgi:perosamine synthetase